MTEKILILDFGSQYTQLIARAVREANVYCEIIPYNKPFEIDATLKGIILSGSPFSVNDAEAPVVDIPSFIQKLPVLGICYGAQLTAKEFGGKVGIFLKSALEFVQHFCHRTPSLWTQPFLLRILSIRLPIVLKTGHKVRGGGECIAHGFTG